MIRLCKLLLLNFFFWINPISKQKLVGVYRVAAENVQNYAENDTNLLGS